MNFSNVIKALIVVSFSALAACSSSKSTDSNVNNLITGAYSSVVAQASKAAGDSGDTLAGAVALQKSIVPFAAPSFDGYWTTTAALNNPITNVGQVTVKQYMGIQLTPDAVRTENGSAVNAFGRLNQALKIFCAVGVASGMLGIPVDNNGYPENGAHTITFSAGVVAQIERQCDMEVSDMLNESFVMTVADSSGSFDKSFSFDAFQQTYHLRSNSTEVNIATGEVHDEGTGVSRTVLFWNKTTKVMRMEYVSDPGTGFTPGQSGLYGYRLFFDETNDSAQLFSYEGPDNNAAQAVRFILAGKPATGDALSLSFKNQNVQANALVEACANSETGDLITDGSRCTASGTRLNGASIGAGGTDAMITDFYTNRGQSAWATVTNATTLVWDDAAEMLTENFVP
jgi:hypothetical protein